MMQRSRTSLLWAVLPLFSVHCGDDAGGASDATTGSTEGDGETVGDGDTAGDGDTVGDGDSVGDGDTGGDGEPPCAPGCPEVPRVFVEGGTYIMGSDVPAPISESPAHDVTVQSLDVATTELTVSAYRACTEASACMPPAGQYEDNENCNFGAPDESDHPLNCVSREQATQACAWLGGRLPSEAEWEFFARSGGEDVEYPWGAVPPDCSLAHMAPGTPPDQGCGTGRTAPVCSYAAGNSSLGLCDLAGNVLELCLDDLVEGYDGAPDDGSPVIDDQAMFHVGRGGSYISTQPTESLRTRARDGVSPAGAASQSNLGFRCVWPAESARQ